MSLMLHQYITLGTWASQCETPPLLHGCRSTNSFNRRAEQGEPLCLLGFFLCIHLFTEAVFAQEFLEHLLAALLGVAAEQVDAFAWPERQLADEIDALEEFAVLAVVAKHAAFEQCVYWRIGNRPVDLFHQIPVRRLVVP